MTWKDYFITLAESIKLKSKDEHTKIGAVIAGPGNEVVSTGYNSFPRDIYDNEPIRQERPEKYYWFSHAETNAIVNAARIGVSTMNCTMYVTSGIPCADCARNIINAGIKKVYCKEMCTTKGEKWAESQKRSLDMFKEAEIEINYY